MILVQSAKDQSLAKGPFLARTICNAKYTSFSLTARATCDRICQELYVERV